MRKRLQGLIVGLLIVASITGGVVFAKSKTQMIEVFYNNIKVYKDNVLCELKDANGTVIEPFIYNGTTYMPVRGTANLADMEVTWDGQTQSVYLWDEQVPNGTFFMDVCPPYEEQSCDIYLPNEGRSFSMSGERYSNGLTLNYTGAYALFNLNSKYSTIECTVGHSGDNQDEKSVAFIVDGKIVKEIELEAEDMPKKVSIPVNYGLQLKILRTECEGYYYSTGVGIGNITVK
ncbi:MAG: NPCBM/NEW2 domain-containing protein [Clostridia bacterium]|nr:NPCBM/NEW2 domain-containing protein [Clostridia bacterium]